MTEEPLQQIEQLQNKISILIELGNTLAKEVEIGGRCACRREWVCFKCQALEAWKKACEDL